MTERYPGYDVLDKRDTPSWNDQTRSVIEERLSLRETEAVLGAGRLATLRRVVARIAPQPERQAPANTAAILSQRIAADAGDGYRPASLPPFQQCWLGGLDAIDAEAQVRRKRGFAELGDEDADAVLSAIAAGEVRASAWDELPPRAFWSWRLLPDVVSAHWAHPSLWSAMGFGGPASPRGYVRLDANRRDPWEAEEQSSG